jgi:hypothetical protein
MKTARVSVGLRADRGLIKRKNKVKGGTVEMIEEPGNRMAVFLDPGGRRSLAAPQTSNATPCKPGIRPSRFSALANTGPG